MSDTRWANVYPEGIRGAMHRSRPEADTYANPDRLYVLRFDLDDEEDRDTITREAI